MIDQSQSSTPIQQQLTVFGSKSQQNPNAFLEAMTAMGLQAHQCICLFLLF